MTSKSNKLFYHVRGAQRNHFGVCVCVSVGVSVLLSFGQGEDLVFRKPRYDSGFSLQLFSECHFQYW